MTSEKGCPLPKFGEWDVNDPASAEGFTVIFNKARDEKKASNNANNSSATPRRNDTGGGGGGGGGGRADPKNDHSRKTVWTIIKHPKTLFGNKGK